MTGAPSSAAPASDLPAFARGPRIRAWELAIWAAAILAWFVLPRQAPMLNEMAILALFAVSLDLILGYAGIVSLGHAAFFGTGAYVAALFAKHWMPDPLVGLAVATCAAALLGLATSVLVLRGSDLTRLMVTLGVALILYELANRFDGITGGADGLQGVVMGPLLGRFAFDMGGRVGYLYSLTVLAVLFFIARRIVHSPFGFGLRAIRDNPRRATAIGIGSNVRLAAVYTLAAAYAGAAGALLAQTTGFASLDVYDFHRSADVLLVLVIGGVGWLYGGVIGAILFTLMHDVLSGLTPQYWQFWIGLLLIILVLVGRERIARTARRLVPGRLRNALSGRATMSVAVLETRGLRKHFGGIAATRDVTFGLERGARHALIGPNGAGKTTLVNLLTGMLVPSVGRILLEGEDITAMPAHRRARKGLVRTFQINQLFDSLTPLESVALTIAERNGGGARFWRPLARDAAITAEATALLTRMHLADVMQHPTAMLPYGKRRLLEIALALASRPRVLLLDEPVAGVPAAESREILQTLTALPADVTVLLIEHDMDLVFRFATRISVLVDGAMLVEGTADEIARDSRVRAVYLGEARHG